MKVGDLVKRIKHSSSRNTHVTLGVVLALESPGMARVFYPEMDNEYWEDSEWLEVINGDR